jgi:hypothetical protein
MTGAIVEHNGSVVKSLLLVEFEPLIGGGGGRGGGGELFIRCITVRIVSVTVRVACVIIHEQALLSCQPCWIRN